MFPQNGDLKKQLHERQPRIAALSDKQVSELEPVPTPLPRWGEGWRGTLAAPKKVPASAPRAQTPKGLRVSSLKLPASPLFWKERAGFLEAEGGERSGRKIEAALKRRRAARRPF